MSERFNKVEPFLDKAGDRFFEIEDDAARYPHYLGKLWAGRMWMTVAEARALHHWLDRALPDEPLPEPLDPRRDEGPIAENE